MPLHASHAHEAQQDAAHEATHMVLDLYATNEAASLLKSLQRLI